MTGSIHHMPAMRADVLRTMGLGPTLHAVATAYHVTPNDILGRSRRQSIARARACLCWRLVHEHGLSTVEVMSLVDRDKSTVWEAIETHWRRIERGEATVPEGVTLDSSTLRERAKRNP